MAKMHQIGFLASVGRLFVCVSEVDTEQQKKTIKSDIT